MKVPKIADALNYLDDDLISEAIEYRPKKRHFYQKTKWKAIAACLALFAAAAGVIISFHQSGTASLVLTAYAMEEDDSVLALPMTEGEDTPVSLFETGDGYIGFVFSYDASDPTQSASVQILDMDSQGSSEKSTEEIVGLETQEGKIYMYYMVAEGETAPYNLPFFIIDSENGIVYQFNIVVEESDGGYTAKLEEVLQYEKAGFEEGVQFEDQR